MTIQTVVTIENDTPLADSRAIAETLGVDHRSFFRLITDYQEEIEKDFGSLRFQIAVKKDNRGGEQPKYALLNENQTYTLMMYTQNTEQARNCKRMLVKAFAEARRQLKEYKSSLQRRAIRKLVQVRACNNISIELEEIDREYRIDSRDVAPNIGIEHMVLMEDLQKYQEQLEHFGFFRFQTGKTTEDERGRGRPSTYVMLNRNQVLFAITLSRNTEQVVAWKMALIDALDQLEKQVRYPYQTGLSIGSTPELKENILEVLARRFQPGERFNRRRIVERGNTLIRSTHAASVGVVLDDLARGGYVGKDGNGRCALYWLLKPIQQ